jgi:hypothetical protein
VSRANCEFNCRFVFLPPTLGSQSPIRHGNVSPAFSDISNSSDLDLTAARRGIGPAMRLALAD